MSLEAMTWAFRQHLRPAEKILLLALADYADDNGACFPSMSTLAEKTSLSERTIRTHLRMLEDLELVTTVERTRENGSRTSNRYVLHMGVHNPVDNQAPAAHPPAEIAGGPGELLPGQEPPLEDLTKTSRVSPELGSGDVRTDSMSPAMLRVARQAGLSHNDLRDIRNAVYAHCGRWVPNILAVAMHLLSKARDEPRSPGLYVLATVRRSSFEVQKYIDESGLSTGRDE